jgi:hypothetical protein
MIGGAKQTSIDCHPELSEGSSMSFAYRRPIGFFAALRMTPSSGYGPFKS